MEPERDEIVDLLDRILEKGVVVNADLIITLADVPLIGIDLRLALAGIDRMLDYGLFD
ncbi:MAG: gas vesicle protein, partial [Candidatus Acetothermia bacterium]